MKRGVEEIVAVVLLIAISVIAGVSIYFWTAGLATKQPTPETPTSIVANPIPGGKVLIANLGQRTINASTIKTSSGNISCPNKDIAPGEQVLCKINATGTVAIYGKRTGGSIVTISGSGTTGGGGTTNSPPQISNYWDNTGGKVENGATVTFYANVSDPDGNLDKVILYTNITGSWQGYEMSLQSGNTYYYQANANVDGTIAYYVYANDTDGANAKTDNKTFLVYTPGATILWYKTYNWGDSDIAYGVFVDSSGIYVTGFRTVSSERDVETAKIDSSGNVTWNKLIGSGNGRSDVGFDLLIVGNTLYVVTRHWINNDHWHDHTIARYSLDGNLLGETYSDWDNSGYDTGMSLIRLGNYIFSVGYGDNPARSGEKDVNLMKTALDGKKQFFKWTYDSGGKDSGDTLTTDGTNIYLTGYSNNSDVLIQKIDQDGNVAYSKTDDIGGNRDAGVRIFYYNNKLYVTGWYYDSSKGYNTPFFAVYDPSTGNRISIRKYDFGEEAYPGRAIIANGYIYLSGKLASSGDGLLAKIDPATGDLIWHKAVDLGGTESLNSVTYYNGVFYSVGQKDDDWLLLAWQDNETAS